MSHSYFAYGLDLKSQTAIDGLDGVSAMKERRATAEIDIATASCPDWAAEALRLPAEVVYSSAPDHEDAESTFRVTAFGGGEYFRLSYPDGTQFMVDAQTRRIWGACSPPLTQEDLATYLLGPVMGFVLRRRGILALHASCFCVGGRAFALCGWPGAGKSTTAAALALRGVPILCEDIVALRERDGGFHAAPGYPRVNLWPESAASLFGASSSLPRITPNWEKQYLPLDGKRAKFENQERSLAAVYVLEERSAANDAPRIEGLSAQDATLLLVQNTYMNYLLERRQRAEEFDAVARLVSRVAVKRLVPSSDPVKLAALCELLEVDASRLARAASAPSASRPR